MATATLNVIGSSHFSAQDLSSSVKSVNILSSSFSTRNGSISGPFDISDYFSSSVPKSSLQNGGNSVHIGSLTNGLTGLSLATPNYQPTTASSLSSGLHSYSGVANNGFPFSSSINNTTSVNGVGTNSGNGNGNFGQEEISTIFVVGFPDDMQEREFQNMFVFTPGFEAATLKIPNKDQQDDDALTLGVNGINPRKQIHGKKKK
ncbi:hypothetical protein B0O80DRAFT_293733 [Mortierella sp. GBAus27b]|nr:hypothetical protein B0O80DRAFT_293733 [Mortierella sp. GBAus27b]